MKTLATLAATSLMLTALPAGAQIMAAPNPPADRPTILVVGTGEAEMPPDTFVIKAMIEQTGPDRDQALRAMDQAQTRVMQGLADMEGLAEVRLTTDAFSVVPVRDPECEQPYGRERECPIVGYKASMPVSMSASPALRAGDAVSLASELGALNASLESFGLSDTDGLQAEANREAFNDARRQAQSLANASGQRIVRVLRVSDANARSYARDAYAGPEEVVVTGSRVRASVPITVAPPPTRVQSSISVLFEIE
ncbi:SIMPL domain-containing protein [Brevundimonas sp.]|uniref:SIMPL domain-containing protein n=1 Tax=Brevundimonas sp. TaxID=1871086 RepID=UPI00272F3FD3|nr:SIMPL domain-containing protein [Brevundimonas sp.]MDP1914201.1 SIMPL domain-containing protein [Brevundimonas sp.]